MSRGSSEGYSAANDQVVHQPALAYSGNFWVVSGEKVKSRDSEDCARQSIVSKGDAHKILPFLSLVW